MHKPSKSTEREASAGMSLKEIEKGAKHEELLSTKQNREERKRFANKIFNFLKVFMLVCLLIVLLCAWECMPFRLSDSVLIALLTTTCADVIGIFIFVVKYLFKT